MQRIRIGIAEDHLLVRQGLISILKMKEDFEIVFDVGDGKQLMNALKEHKPDIILLDIRMPEMDGREALIRIKGKYPEIKVIILSSHYNTDYIMEFIMDGAAGFLPKACDIEKLADVIHVVYEQGHYFDEKVSELFTVKLRNTKYAVIEKALTARQIEITKLLYDEKTSEEISKMLFLSKRTVEWHRNKIFEKTGTKTSIGLFKYAISNGIINL